MGRDIKPITISGEDRRQYREKLQRSLEVFARMLREHLFEADPAQVGLEIELNLVDERGVPSMQYADVLDAIADPAWATELGQPWVSTSGSGSGPAPGACTRCTETPPTSARRWVSRSSLAWRASGSNARQSSINWASQSPGTPRCQVPPPAGSRAVPRRSARSPDASMSSAARNGSARRCGEAMPRSWRTGRPRSQPHPVRPE